MFPFAQFNRSLSVWLCTFKVKSHSYQLCLRIMPIEKYIVKYFFYDLIFFQYTL